MGHHAKSLRLALRALLLALALARTGVVAQTFVTALAGLGGTPVGLTPLNQPGASVMNLYSLANVDPDAVCNGAPAYLHGVGVQTTGCRATQAASARETPRHPRQEASPAHVN